MKRPLTAACCSALLSFAIDINPAQADNTPTAHTPAEAAIQQPDTEQQRLILERKRILEERHRLLNEEQKLLDEELKQKGLLQREKTVIREGDAVDSNKNSGVHTHDGFFLRLAPGIGYMANSETVGASKYEYSGASTVFNIAIGGAIADNLIIHLDLSGSVISDPTLKIDGQSTATATRDHATSVLGLGLTYYFPSNFYVTGAAGTATTSLKSNNATYKTDDGYGINLMLGKEWWVSDNWGLGVAGQWLYTDCPDKPYAGTTSHVKSSSFGVLFSATYN